MGSESAIQSASSMIEFLDVPPKQIVVEVKIIEVNSQKLQNIGIDWQKILANTSVPFQYSYSRWHNNSSSDGTSSGSTQRTEETSYGVSNSMKIGDFLNVLVSSDAAKVLNIPKIVTVNNKKGTIHDGSRILYVDKYASYSNLFQTQELKTGLYLSVTPSLGASGYIKMNVEAKLTDLNNASNDLRPIEVGQTVENIVVVKEGQSIMLGGLKKTSTEKIDNSLPILGSILPFLFSSQKNIEITNDVLLILTPTTIDITKVQAPDTLNEKSEK
jgi:type II secretory pathway component GspD/PulD (secretin)